MLTTTESLITIILVGAVVVLLTGCGLCVLLTGWRGKSAGLILGGLTLAVGCAAMMLITSVIARYWWIGLPPILIGIQSIRVWRQTGANPGISLSSLLLFMGFMAAMSAGATNIYRQYQAEKPIVARIESLVDGDIEYDFDGLVLGVVIYELDRRALDEVLVLLRSLRYLQRLQLDHCEISTAQARQIGGLRSLRQLWLQATDIDDEKVAELARLEYLKDLDLMDTQVSGCGLQHLWGAVRLRHLWLSSDYITADDVAQLRDHLPDLEVSY